ACIQGSRLLDEAERDRLVELPRDRRLVFVCHHGGRSLRAAQSFAALGFSQVDNVVGGIDAWAQTIDPSVARY
ncbi:MAG: rhodanese-like domain-containing protein, partial [Myxococcales bacterium FL481]